MILEIEDSIVKNSQLTEAEIRLELAVMLFLKKRLTLVQASELADVPVIMFKNWTSNYSFATSPKMPLNLDVEKFPKNLKDFAVQPNQLRDFSTLFENELSAEELCKML
jgi:Uncharacterised protein family (UPF0175)